MAVFVPALLSCCSPASVSLADRIHEEKPVLFKCIELLLFHILLTHRAAVMVTSSKPCTVVWSASRQLSSANAASVPFPDEELIC